ncbi:MAG: hypothetical protein U9N51_09670 [Bacteroidota bacterium]|nr:hypothetical protein [Bacteroidota bacterium]
MKRLLIIFTTMLFAISAIAQENNTQPVEDTTLTTQDSIVPWTGNMVGLNVYPAFGMLGGGVLPASKIFFQYRHMWEKTNLRFSVNYINYFSDNERMDIVGVEDSLMTLREFANIFYSLDFRVGIERTYHIDNFRFYYGIGAIAGYHHLGKEYYVYDKPFGGYPVEYINTSIVYQNAGWYRADMLKVGADITLGVDIILSENVIMSVQYAPEIAYYSRMDSQRDDQAEVFVGDVDDFMDFRADFIDVVLSVGF